MVQLIASFSRAEGSFIFSNPVSDTPQSIQACVQFITPLSTATAALHDLHRIRGLWSEGPEKLTPFLTLQEAFNGTSPTTIYNMNNIPRPQSTQYAGKRLQVIPKSEHASTGLERHFGLIGHVSFSSRTIEVLGDLFWTALG
jgi:hypothetical protein